MLEWKVRLVPGGTILDNCIVYMRNRHTLISMFFPMSYSSINIAERLAIILVTSGVAYFLSALLNNDNYGLNFILVTVPTILTDYGMTYLVTREEDPKECKMRQKICNFLSQLVMNVRLYVNLQVKIVNV
eukprot:UN22478